MPQDGEQVANAYSPAHSRMHDTENRFPETENDSEIKENADE
jgi:hypothetical protein